ncbi:Phosphatidate cytidylyltransferase [Phytophthora citrophthora]|uniref:Phosphatidate cytidylyltransferase n=1 Tax=Phytophthora citrophthora TaxID=4793 RepID=A0AAD9GTC5_9STRA|nr:Phosphatidate cytidylyltransferase [Phytophthora citrophthora]
MCFPASPTQYYPSCAAILPQSSQGTVLSPHGEYLSYSLESSEAPPDHKSQHKWDLCLAFLQLNVVQRVLSALVLAPAVTAFLWLSPAFATSTVCSFVVSACSYEYACLSNRIRLRILIRLDGLEGIWDEDSTASRSNVEVRRQTVAEEFMSDNTFSHSQQCRSSTTLEADTILERLRSSQTDLRSHWGEQEEEEIVRADEELHDQEMKLGRHAVSALASTYCFGNDKLAAACISLVLCAVSSVLFLLSIQHAKAIQSTEFYESRWFYSITTSFVAAFCACMAPDWQYALTILVQYGVFTVLAMYSTGCPLNDFSCGIGLDPEVALLVGMLIVLICRSTCCSSGAEAFLTFMLDVLGLFYISGTLSVLVAFVDDERRLLYRELLIALLYIVWASDTGAYITGKVLEYVKYPYYHPLAAHLSKNKDYEGTIGAIIFGIGAMAIVSKVLELPGSFQSKVLFTIAAVIIGRIGDLFESLLKRVAGVKDSGKLIPGHGGMLDRIDALMFATLVFSRYSAVGPYW